MLRLEITKRTDSRLTELMRVHYSHPEGFVGRNICYAIYYADSYLGHIVAGSATRHLPGRRDFFGGEIPLNNLVNNIFYHLAKPSEGYPTRNVCSRTLSLFRDTVCFDWQAKYSDDVLGFESLIELPRTGECYLRDGWTVVGRTKGYQCKRVSGESTDSWTGRRVWITDIDKLRPKLVLCRHV